MGWDGVGWGGVRWDGVGWNGLGWIRKLEKKTNKSGMVFEQNQGSGAFRSASIERASPS